MPVVSVTHSPSTFAGRLAAVVMLLLALFAAVLLILPAALVGGLILLVVIAWARLRHWVRGMLPDRSGRRNVRVMEESDRP